MDGKQTAAQKKREHKPENPFSILFYFRAAICKRRNSMGYSNPFKFIHLGSE
jgi:hypothetical protein